MNCNTWSDTNVKIPSKATQMAINTVEPFSSSQVGHEHFFSSSRVSVT